jgi:phosphoketolase
MIYLLADSLLKEPLKPEHVKNRPLGGTACFCDA